jgi:hypothetical protein
LMIIPVILGLFLCASNLILLLFVNFINMFSHNHALRSFFPNTGLFFASPTPILLLRMARPSAAFTPSPTFCTLFYFKVISLLFIGLKLCILQHTCSTDDPVVPCRVSRCMKLCFDNHWIIHTFEPFIAFALLIPVPQPHISYLHDLSCVFFWDILMSTKVTDVWSFPVAKSLPLAMFYLMSFSSLLLTMLFHPHRHTPQLP